jgi:hypothetical protein
MRYGTGLFVSGLLLVAAAQAASAEEAVQADPKHYAVDFENDQVRVLRIKYGAHEKSVMHAHPAGVAVFLTDHHVKFTYPDGKTEEVHGKAGGTRWNEAVTHNPENTGDQPLEVILVELKGPPAGK